MDELHFQDKFLIPFFGKDLVIKDFSVSPGNLKGRFYDKKISVEIM